MSSILVPMTNGRQLLFVGLAMDALIGHAVVFRKAWLFHQALAISDLEVGYNFPQATIGGLLCTKLKVLLAPALRHRVRHRNLLFIFKMSKQISWLIHAPECLQTTTSVSHHCESTYGVPLSRRSSLRGCDSGTAPIGCFTCCTYFHAVITAPCWFGMARELCIAQRSSHAFNVGDSLDRTTFRSLQCGQIPTIDNAALLWQPCATF